MKTNYPGIIISALFMIMLAEFSPAQESPSALSKTYPAPIIKLKVHPKGEPSPALRYTLFPELREQSPGNAVQGYYRAFSPEWTYYRRDKEYHKKQDKWLSVPLKDFNEKEVNTPNYVLKQIRESTLKSYCDWDLTQKLRKEGAHMLLPDVQVMREFATALAIDCRVQLKKGNINQAIEDIKAGFTLSHHMGEGPTLIQALAAVAIGWTMFARLEEVMEEEKAPNLYWALTALPRPLVDFRYGFSGETGIIDHLFPDLREMLYAGKIRSLSPEEIRNTLSQWRVLHVEVGLDRTKKQLWVDSQSDAALQTAFLANLAPAKKMLLEQGIPEGTLADLPPVQVVFMAEALHYDKFFQNIAKWRNIPYHLSLPHIRANAEEIKKNKPPMDSPTSFGRVTTLLAPTMEVILGAGPKMERRIAAFRVIEALRMQAARDKSWPDSLEKVTVAPVPEDPFTGKPFPFKKEGNLITITAPAPGGDLPNKFNSFTYELQLGN